MNNFSILSANEFVHLSFGDRVSLAKEMTKSYGLTIFLVMFAAGLFFLLYTVVCMGIMGINPSFLIRGSLNEYSSGGLLIGLLLIFLLTIFIIPFFSLGLRNLILIYLAGEEPDSVISSIMAPASRKGFFATCFLLWFGVNICFQLFYMVLGLIPFLGVVIILIASFFFNMAVNCSYSYMADMGLRSNELTTPTNTIIVPFHLVWDNLWKWLGTALFVILLLIVPLSLLCFGLFAGMTGDQNGGMSFIGLAMIICGSILTLLVTIFDLFIMTITYKQTVGGASSDSSMVSDVF